MKKTVLASLGLAVCFAAGAQGFIPVLPNPFQPVPMQPLPQQQPMYQQQQQVYSPPPSVNYQRIGNTTFGSDGSTYQRIGNTTFGPNGRSCQTIGNSTFCN